MTDIIREPGRLIPSQPMQEHDLATAMHVMLNGDPDRLSLDDVAMVHREIVGSRVGHEAVVSSIEIGEDVEVLRGSLARQALRMLIDEPRQPIEDS